jgi:LemA protein
MKARRDELTKALRAITPQKIAAARRYYNNVVQRFNTKQQTLPTSLIAGALGFSPRDFYRLEDDAERDPVEVGFSA